MKNHCDGCCYYRQLTKNRTECACHYLLDTGHSRGCKVEDCTLYQTEEMRKAGPERYCKFADDTVLYVSEDDPAYAERGFYNHGKYPFVVDRLFPIKDSPADFGYINIMRSPQIYIDKLDADILKNAAMPGKPHWFVRLACGVNEEKFADWRRDFVHVAGCMEPDDLKQVDARPLPAFIANHHERKIVEIKETSGNRGVSS